MNSITEAVVIFIFGVVLLIIAGIVGYTIGYESRILDEKKRIDVERELDEHAKDWDRLSQRRKKTGTG